MTKWSELYGALTVRLDNEKTRPATMIKFSRAHDLALLKFDASDLAAAKWAGDEASPPGTLVAAQVPGASPQVGIASHDARSVAADRGGGLSNLIDSPDGVQVVEGGWIEVFDLPLQKGDIILSVEGHATPTLDPLLKLLGDSNHPGTIVAYAGDPISLVVRRDDVTLPIRFPLPAATWPRPDGESRRCSGFPAVFDIDMRLRPEHCGAPLVDLQGRVLGVAIACRRPGQTHVIPAATARRFLADEPGFTAERKD